MQIEEIISKNVEDIESLIPKIDEKIENHDQRIKRKLKIWTGAITASLLFFFLCKSILLPQYETFQKRRQQIKITDQLSEDYRLELTSILNDDIVDPEEYYRLIAIKKALPDLEKRYKPLGVKRDFATLEKKVSKGERIYQAELERKRQIALLDKEFNLYKSAFESISINSVDEVKRKELERIKNDIEKLVQEYSLLNAEKNKVKQSERLKSKILQVTLKFDLKGYKERFIVIKKYLIDEEYERVENEISNIMERLSEESTVEYTTFYDEVKQYKTNVLDPQINRVNKLIDFVNSEFNSYKKSLSSYDVYGMMGMHKRCEQLVPKIKSRKFRQASDMMAKTLKYLNRFQLKISTIAQQKFDEYIEESIKIKELAKQGRYSEAKSMSIRLQSDIRKEKKRGLFSNKYLRGS